MLEWKYTFTLNFFIVASKYLNQNEAPLWHKQLSCFCEALSDLMQVAQAHFHGFFYSCDTFTVSIYKIRKTLHW